MNINCNIAADLLPLYLDESCSADSRAALEAHLHACPACREKLERMRTDEHITTATHTAPIVNYARKVRGHKLRKAILAALCSVTASFFLALCALIAQDMYATAHPTVHSVEEGVHNLTAHPLTTTAGEVDDHVLFTNYTRIEVTLDADEPFTGTVLLYNAAHDEPILYGRVDARTNRVQFNGLTSAARYRVAIEGASGTLPVTVTEGRHISPWNSLKNLLGIPN